MMKNKLVKYNHKAPYYIMRKIGFCAILFFCLSATVVVPTTINLLTTNPSIGLAEGESSEITETENEELVSYTSIQQN